MAIGMGGGFDSSGPEGLGADAFGGEGKSSRIAFYMDDTPQHFVAFSNSPPSVNYYGGWGSGYAKSNPGGVGWGFTPSLILIFLLKDKILMLLDWVTQSEVRPWGHLLIYRGLQRKVNLTQALAWKPTQPETLILVLHMVGHKTTVLAQRLVICSEWKVWV